MSGFFSCQSQISCNTHFPSMAYTEPLGELFKKQISRPNTPSHDNSLPKAGTQEIASSHATSDPNCNQSVSSQLGLPGGQSCIPLKQDSRCNHTLVFPALCCLQEMWLQLQIIKGKRSLLQDFVQT
jgi:hypothetical protein